MNTITPVEPESKRASDNRCIRMPLRGHIIPLSNILKDTKARLLKPNQQIYSRKPRNSIRVPIKYIIKV